MKNVIEVIAKIAHVLWSWVKHMADLYMRFKQHEIFHKEEDLATPSGMLKFWDAMGSEILEVGFFLTVAWATWHRYGWQDNAPRAIKDWIPHLLKAGPPCFLVLLFGVIFLASRRSSKVELAISERLFPQGQAPAEWSAPKDPVWITLSVLCFFLLYMALAWFAYKIYLASFFMLLIACIDFNTRRLIHKSVRKYFADPKYAPCEDARDRDVILKWRGVVEQYLFSLPHLWKEAGRVAGCFTAFALAVPGYLYRADWMIFLSYLVLIGTLITNEVISSRWRGKRDRRLMKIEDENKAHHAS